MKKAPKSKSRGFFKVQKDQLFLHKLQSINSPFRLHPDKIHPAVQSFKVNRSYTLGVALLVDLLSHGVEHHNLAILFGQADAELTLVGVGIESDAICHCFLCGHDDFGRREDDVV